MGIGVQINSGLWQLQYTAMRGWMWLIALWCYRSGRVTDTIASLLKYWTVGKLARYPRFHTLFTGVSIGYRDVLIGPPEYCCQLYL